MQILKRGDIVLLPAKVTGFSTDGAMINVEVERGRALVFDIPIDSVTVATFSLIAGDRVSLFTSEINPATVLGATKDEVWVMQDGAEKSATVSRKDVKGRLPDFEQEHPAMSGEADHG